MPNGIQNIQLNSSRNHIQLGVFTKIITYAMQHLFINPAEVVWTGK